MDNKNEVIPRNKSDVFVNTFTELKTDGRIDLLLRYYDPSYRKTITIHETEMLQFLDSNHYPRLIAPLYKEREPNLLSLTLKMVVEKNLLFPETEQLITNNGIKEGKPYIIGYYPTNKGVTINERGGWIKHRERKESDRNLTRDVGASVKTTNNYQKVSIVLTIAIILSNLAISILTFTNAQDEILQANIKQQKIDQLTKQNKLEQLETQKTYQEYADHLFRQLDSLTTALKAKNAEQLK